MCDIQTTGTYERPAIRHIRKEIGLNTMVHSNECTHNFVMFVKRLLWFIGSRYSTICSYFSYYCMIVDVNIFFMTYLQIQLWS